MERDIEQQLLSCVAELGVAVVAHSPTSHGLLHRPRSTGDESVPSGMRGALDEIAATHAATAGQVALAWVHHRQQAHGVRVVPIPGTGSISHLRSNIAAATLDQSNDELRRLGALEAAS